MTNNTVDINVGKSHTYSGGSSSDGAGTAALAAKVEKLQKALNSEISTRTAADNTLRDEINSKANVSDLAGYVTSDYVDSALNAAKITVADSYVTVKNDKTQLSLALNGNVLSIVKYDVPEITGSIVADKRDVDPTESVSVQLSFNVEADTNIEVKWYDETDNELASQTYEATSGSKITVQHTFDGVSYDDAHKVHAVVTDERGFTAQTGAFDMVNVFSKYIYYTLVDTEQFSTRELADAHVKTMTEADWKALTTKQRVSPAASNNATFTISDAGQYYIYFALQESYGHTATCTIDGNVDVINLDVIEEGSKTYFISTVEIDNTTYNIYIAAIEAIDSMDITPVNYAIS